jgi:spore coat polysaccharide biosynthesis protein SpsF
MTGRRQLRVVLQARTSSVRMPAKVLLPLAGYPLVVLCAKRLARGGLDVVVATSDSPSDDALAETLTHASIQVFRGSLDDVLDRLTSAVGDLTENDTVVRATADNPFPDAAFLKNLVAFFDSHDIDYAGTNSPADGLPYGLSAEVMSVSALRRASLHAKTPFDREHVTPWIIRNCRTAAVTNEHWDFPVRPELRCTIDSFDDYLRLVNAFAPFVSDPISVSWQRLVETLADQPGAPAFRVPFVVRENAAESELCLGTVQLGLPYGINNLRGCPPEEEAIAIIRRAVDHGVTWLDTAHAYGESERRIGRALRGSWRTRTRVVTKLSPLTELPQDADLRCIEAAVDASIFQSLARLEVGSLDIVMLHRWKHHEAYGGAIWNRLLSLRQEGVLRELGASLDEPGDAVAALSNGDIRHLQIPFNLLDHRWQDTKFRAAAAARPDVRIHIRSVFLQGLLLGDAARWPMFDPAGARRLVEIDRLVTELARRDRADLCVAYVRAHPWVSSVVLGVESLSQLDVNLRLAGAPPLTPSQATAVRERLGGAPLRLLDPSKWPT